MKKLFPLLFLALFLLSLKINAQEEQAIVVQNYYWAKEGKIDEVYAHRLYASEVRDSLGLAVGRVLKRIGTNGELILGNRHKLYVMDNTPHLLYFDNNSFVLSYKCSEKARDIFTRWYKQQARKIIARRTEYYSSIFGYKYNKITIRNQQTRWGSCSGRNNLNFNWRLIMAPLNVIDYVVVHELSHIEEKNHSRRFWDKVSNVMPDYKNHRNWLKENGHSLFL